jgi:hypothetical protein
MSRGQSAPPDIVRSKVGKLGFAFLALFWALPAAAQGSGGMVAGEAGGALVHGPEGFDPGATAGAEALHGLDDVWSARGGLAIAAARGNAQGWREDVTLELGASAALDVLRVIPFAQLGAAVTWGGIGDSAAVGGQGLRAGLQGAIGADYLLDRAWSLGLVLRGRVLPVRVSGSSEDGGGGSLTANLRVGWRY